MATTPVLTAAEYEQTCISIRHYSNLRYAILTVFIAINGALIAAVYGKDVLASRPEIAFYLQLFGLASSIAFWWIEFTIDGYLVAFSKFACDGAPTSHWTQRPKVGKRFITLATMLPHLFLLLFWSKSLLTSHKPPAIDAAKSTDVVIAAIPALSRASDANWRVDELSWNESINYLDVLLRDANSGQLWLVGVDASSGSIARALKVPSPVAALSSPPEVLRISELQARLRDRGYPVGNIDGIMGHRTIRALQLFQKAEGLPITVEPTVETVARLIPKPTRP